MYVNMKEVLSKLDKEPTHEENVHYWTFPPSILEQLTTSEAPLLISTNNNTH